MPTKSLKKHFNFLNAIIDHLNGKISQDELRESLKKARTSFAEFQNDFEQEISEIEDDIKEDSKQELTMVYKFFADWENSFAAVENYFTTGQKFDLISAAEMVKRSKEGLNYALDVFKDKVLLVIGPTDIPRLNLLVNTVDEVLNGAPKDKLEVIVGTEYTIAQGAKQELQVERKFVVYNEQELLINAYQELQDALKMIMSGVNESNEEKIIGGIEACKNVYPKIRQLISNLNYRRASSAPTKSPSINILINLAAGLKKGLVTEAMLVRALRKAEMEVSLVSNRFKYVGIDTQGEEHVDKQLDETYKGLGLYRDAIKDYYEFFRTREVLYLDSAELRLKKAADILHSSLEFFNSLSEIEGKTPCVKCGHYNMPDRKLCSECGAILPTSAEVKSSYTIDYAESEDPADAIIPENLERIFIDVDRMAEGDITAEEFRKTIEWLREVIEESRKSIPPIREIDYDKINPNDREKYKKAESRLEKIRETFGEGCDELEQGLNCFEEYMEKEEKILLANGVNIMWEGNKKLNKAKKMLKKLDR